MAVVLHQFEFSHFNDKARWALAFKGVEHERISYLPGPHMGKIKKLSGQQQTPVLELEGRVVSGSADIIHALEARFPEPSLYPQDQELRRQALAVQSRFDAEVGPASRTVLFSALVHEADYLCEMFARKAGNVQRWLYRATFPVAKGMIARGNGVKDPANVKAAFEIFARTLDDVAESTAATGYLVGDDFSVADLTAAALMAPLANPEHDDMRRPQPVPSRVQEVQAQFSGHPALQWVADMYARHRS